MKAILARARLGNVQLPNVVPRFCYRARTLGLPFDRPFFKVARTPLPSSSSRTPPSTISIYPHCIPASITMQHTACKEQKPRARMAGLDGVPLLRPFSNSVQAPWSDLSNLRKRQPITSIHTPGSRLNACGPSLTPHMCRDARTQVQVYCASQQHAWSLHAEPDLLLFILSLLVNVISILGLA
jgi:hypothetical protein